MSIQIAPSLSDQLRDYKRHCKLITGKEPDPVKIKEVEAMIRGEKIRLFFEKRFYKKAAQGNRTWHHYAIKNYEKAGGNRKWLT